MIHAKIHELKNTFTAHLFVYKLASPKRVSHRLLLFYAVECGLKVLMLKKIKGTTTESFMKHRELKDRLNGKNGHNIKYMLRFLGYGQFNLPNMRCLNEANAMPSEYNQIWRYGIQIMKDQEDDIEKTLFEITEWIERRI